PGYDLCFATYGLEPPAPRPPPSFLHVAPVAAAVAAKPRDWNLPGAYGYFLSRRGVDTLLDRVARDGLSGDVDRRLLASSLGKAGYDGLSPQGFAATALRRHEACLETLPPIVGYCLYPALFAHGITGSIRMADNIMR